MHLGDAVLFALNMVIWQKNCHNSGKCLICGRRHYVLLRPDVRKENPISPKDILNNAKKKTSWITSELTNEDIQKPRLAVLGIVQIEQLYQLKEKIQRHFSSPSDRHGMVDDQITKRLNWPLGRVIELYPGKEGIERISKLRVANGFAIRPLQRL
ncbi:hypothetical protein TNCV_1384391 [Trichonephila clavipes]|nr:hypothetical protein TNCV_1384391 [Trichonephila clavipes]